MDPKPESLSDPSETTLGVFLGISWILFLFYFFWNRGNKKGDVDQMSLITSEFSMSVSDEKTSTPFQSVPTAAYENPNGPI